MAMQLQTKETASLSYNFIFLLVLGLKIWLLSTGIKGIGHHHLGLFLHWSYVAQGTLNSEIHLFLSPKFWD